MVGNKYEESKFRKGAKYKINHNFYGDLSVGEAQIISAHGNLCITMIIEFFYLKFDIFLCIKSFLLSAMKHLMSSFRVLLLIVFLNVGLVTLIYKKKQNHLHQNFNNHALMTLFFRIGRCCNYSNEKMSRSWNSLSTLTERHRSRRERCQGNGRKRKIGIYSNLLFF